MTKSTLLVNHLFKDQKITVRLFISHCVLLISITLMSQNLIPNPSFDSLLPNYAYSTSVFDKQIDNNYPHWSNPHQTTPVALVMLIYGAADLTFGISETIDKNTSGVRLFSYD
jgi:2-iminoacetate synthase ThiH